MSAASVYRHRAALTAPQAVIRPRPAPPRALRADQTLAVLDFLHESRFIDQAPSEIYATLLDEGVYHCSIRTLYSILGDHNALRERHA